MNVLFLANERECYETDDLTGNCFDEKIVERRLTYAKPDGSRRGIMGTWNLLKTRGLKLGILKMEISAQTQSGGVG